MRIAVVGAGAIGSFFGGLLARAEEDVLFLARGTRLRALRDHGLSIESPAGDFAIPDVRVSDNPTEAGPIDVVLVCVKAWQVAEAARGIAPMIGGKTIVVPLQNGVEAADQLAGVLGREHVVGGTCRVICKMVGPGQVVHVGVPPRIEIGELDGKPSERTERLATRLDSGGLGGRVTRDIHVALWRKFLFIAPVSGLGALSNSDVGALRALPETRTLLEHAMAEIRDLALARGVSMRQDIVERTMLFLDGLPPEGTSSMQRDILEGRPSELEAQNGAVVRLAAEVGIDVPVHRLIYGCLLPHELRARRQMGQP